MHAISKVIQSGAKSLLTMKCQGTFASLCIVNYKTINVEVSCFAQNQSTLWTSEQRMGIRSDPRNIKLHKTALWLSC